MKNYLWGMLGLVIIVGGCLPQSQSYVVSETFAETVTTTPTATAIPSPTPAGPEVVVTHPELEVISPENINRLEQVASWGEGKIYDYAVSPDESTIAVSTARTVFILDSSDLKIVQAITREVFPDSVQGNPVEFSPDGQYLVYATNNSIYMVDLSTGDNRYMGQSVLDHLSVRSIYISPDNSTITLVTYGSYNACDGAGGNISVYGPSKYLGSPYYTKFFCHPAMPMIRYTNTGLGYIFFEYAFSYDIPVLDLQNQVVKKKISSDDISPTGMIESISPDGKTYAVSMNEGGQWKVQIVDAVTYITTQVLDGRMNDVSYSENDGKWQVNPPESTFGTCGFEVQGKRVLEVIHSDDQSSSALVIFRGNKFQIWNLNDCTVENELDLIQANSLKISLDNHFMAFQDLDMIFLRDMVSGEVLFKFSFEDIPDVDPSITYDFSPDSKYLVAGLYSKVEGDPIGQVIETHAVSVWDLHTGKQVNLFRQSGSPLVTVDASSGNGLIILSTKEGVELWNYLQGELLYTLPTGTLLQSSSDEIMFLDQSSRVVSYTPSSGLTDQISDLPDEIVSVLAVNSEAATLTSLLERNDVYSTIVQYSLITGSSLHSMRINGVHNVIPANSSHFLILYKDGSFDIWDSDTFQLIHHYAGYTDLSNLKDHNLDKSEGDDYFSIGSYAVDDAFLSGNSDFVITYEYSKGLRVWDIRTQDYLGDITLNYLLDGYLPSLEISFSPDGRLTAVAGDDGIIRLWGVKAEE